MKGSKIRNSILGLATLIVSFAISASASGPSVSFTTFLAGSNSDVANAVAIDSAGNTYVAGFTQSTNFPVVLPSQSSSHGQGDAFLTKLSPSGAILFSTYWGGSGLDAASGVAVDSTGVYITGTTYSSDFPGQRWALGDGKSHAFISKFSLTGQEIYSLVFGGSDEDSAYGIAVDSLHQAYITGVTYSTNFPASTNRYHGGFSDAFVAKIDSYGNLIDSAYVGGSRSDYGIGIAIDPNGFVYITGTTSSADFPLTVPATATPGDVHCSPAGCNTFVTKLNSALSIQYSNVIGFGWNQGTAIWADSVRTYVTGTVYKNSYFPTTPGAFQSARPSAPNAVVSFVAELDSTYGELIYSSYLGGNDQGWTLATSIAVQGGNVFVAGNTNSTSFPGAPAITPNPTAGFVVKLAPQLNGLYYTTFLGASINGIAVDLRPPGFPLPLSNVEVYTAGYRYTGSTAPQSQDAFAVKLVESPTIICCGPPN